ncbi:MAG: SHD1 domain-containing protein [Kiritimatiellaeota bacterium]|nr:SHD1 domain-containing protein [Kiritimatiellota bacterium]
MAVDGTRWRSMAVGGTRWQSAAVGDARWLSAAFGGNGNCNRRIAMRKVCGIGVVMVCLAGGVAAQEEATAEALREWTSVNGNVVEAAFVREEDGKVFLRLADGKTISTSREKLSPNDLAWIDTRTGAAPKAGDAKTESFTLIKSQAEKLKLETFLTIKGLIIRTYADLTNNHREDKSLAFLLRDANKVYGWASITAECYPLPNGQKGKVKAMTFYLPTLVELREAVQIMREKLRIVMPDPVVMKEIREYGMPAWEAQNPPDYISRILLVKDSYAGKISRIMVSFPAPEKN